MCVCVIVYLRGCAPMHSDAMAPTGKHFTHTHTRTELMGVGMVVTFVSFFKSQCDVCVCVIVYLRGCAPMHSDATAPTGTCILT